MALCLMLVAGCASDGSPRKSDSGATVLNWYTAPDRVNAQALADECSELSLGAYEIKVRELPGNPARQRAQLVRMLAVEDTVVDLISLDTEATAEFAAGKLLAPIPDDLEPEFTASVFPAALAASTFDGELVSVPWWFDPWLLWYRGAVAERAGLDITQPISWTDLIDGAQRVGTTVQFDDFTNTGIVTWLHGLLASAGGSIVSGPKRTSDVGFDSAAGRTAADVVARYSDAGVGQYPTANDAGPLDAFADPEGGFLLAPSSVISDPAIASIARDLRWAPWPVLESATTTPSMVPVSGRGLAVSLYSSHSDLAFDAIGCLTSPRSAQAMMVSSGHSSARSTTFDLPAVTTGYPMAEVVRASVENGVPLPQSPYWQQIVAGIQGSWLPVAGVSRERTPTDSQKIVESLLEGELP